MNLSLKDDLKKLAAVSIAALIFSVNLKTFVHTGGLYPAGFTGVAVLIQRAALRYFALGIPYTPVNLLLNAFPIYIGLRFLGKKLTFFSVVLIVLNSVLTDLIPPHAITYDPLLISIFGGMISGFASSLCLLAGSSAGGTDFISMYLSEKHGIDAFNIILGANAVLLLIAGLLFGWDKALYSILYQYFSTQVIHLLFRRYQQMTLFIVTDHPYEICEEISRLSNHGATIMQATGAYAHTEREVVYSVVSSQEYKKVIAAVEAADPHAFINSLKTERLRGFFYRKPNE